MLATAFLQSRVSKAHGPWISENLEYVTHGLSQRKKGGEELLAVGIIFQTGSVPLLLLQEFI